MNNKVLKALRNKKNKNERIKKAEGSEFISSDLTKEPPKRKDYGGNVGGLNAYKKAKAQYDRDFKANQTMIDVTEGSGSARGGQSQTGTDEMV